MQSETPIIIYSKNLNDLIISLRIITEWLLLLRQATEQMSATKSATKQVTLLAVHAVFHSLQDHLKASLRKLPNNAPTQR
jgi:hypothetical protein